jgi:hypothetical protein
MQLPTSVKAGFFGFAQWTGEALIGLIPWILYVIVNEYSSLPAIGICSAATYNAYTKQYSGCIPLPENASPEICILAVVISGLAVLSVVPFGRRQREITIWTRLLVLLAILALIFGSLFYALFTAHLDRNADTIVYIVLLAALVSSLCLSIEGAILSS